jgi:hypothetical protein
VYYIYFKPHLRKRIYDKIENALPNLLKASFFSFLSVPDFDQYDFQILNQPCPKVAFWGVFGARI